MCNPVAIRIKNVINDRTTLDKQKEIKRNEKRIFIIITLLKLLLYQIYDFQYNIHHHLLNCSII